MSEFLGLTFLFAGFVSISFVSFIYRPVGYALIVAFSVRALAACVHYWVFPFPQGVADAVAFERTAWRWAQGGFFHALFQFDPTGTGAYSWAASLLYAVTDRSALMLQALNVLGGTLIVLNAYLITKELWGTNRAKIVAWFLALFPQLIQLSAVTHREVAIVYPFTLGAFFLVKWGRAKRVRFLILALLFFSVPTLIHGGFIASLVAAALFAGGSAFRASLRRLLVRKIKIPVVVVLLIVGGLGASVVITGEMPEVSKVGDLTEVTQKQIADRMQAAARGGAVYRGINPTGSGNVVIQTPLRLAYFFFSPMPWDVRKAKHLLGLLDAALYFVIFWGLWRSRHRIWQNRGALAILFVVIVTASAFALGTSNFGTSIRHRAKFVPILAALWASPVFRTWIVLTKHR